MADASHDAAPTVFLHIGCPKSGTSHIQDRLSSSPEAVREQGLYWPMPWTRQVQAVRDLRRADPESPPPSSGAWAKIVADVTASGADRALISMEWLVGIRPDTIAACVESLAPARVEIICTARDLLRTLPAHWQESTQNYRTWGWEAFLDAVMDPDRRHPAGREFWRQHDVPSILTRWSAAVPSGHTHLVTLPPDGGERDLLWRRFCSVVSIDPDAIPSPGRFNQSLGVQAARLMEEVNVAAHERGISKDFYIRHFKHYLSKVLLAEEQAHTEAIAVSDPADRWIRQAAERMVKETEPLPVNVVGDLADLLPGPRLVGRIPSTVSDREVLDTAVETIIALLQARGRKASG